MAFHTYRTARPSTCSPSALPTRSIRPTFYVFSRDRHPERGRFAGGSELKWIDSGLFDEGNDVEIQMGYQEAAARSAMFDFMGEITAVSAKPSESGVPTLTVRGFSFFHQLQRRIARKPFGDSTDSEIARKIAKAMGWQASIHDTVATRPMLSAVDKSYAAILTSRAQRLGYEVAVKKKTHFRGATLSAARSGVGTECATCVVSARTCRRTTWCLG